MYLYRVLFAGIPAIFPFHRDEIPYKTTEEGGFNASVAYIPAWENVLHGQNYLKFLIKHRIKPGDKFIVQPVSDTPDYETEPVPTPTFIPVLKNTIFDNFKERIRWMLNTPVIPAQYVPTFLIVPYSEGLNTRKPWEIQPYKIE